MREARDDQGGGMIEDQEPKFAEAEGKTVNEAIRRGLIATGWDLGQLTVEVLSTGSTSPWVNQEVARVRLHWKTADAFELAQEVTSSILERMKLAGNLSTERRQDHIRILVSGEGLDRALLEDGGEPLDALQHLVSRIVSKRSGSRQMVNIDLGGFRERRERELRDMAYRIADDVRQSCKQVMTEAMPAQERRVIHLALNEDPDITTFAVGEGLVKQIVVAPIDQAPPPEERRGDRRGPRGAWGGGRGDRGGRGGDRGGRGGDRGARGRGDRGDRDRGPRGGRGGGPRPPRGGGGTGGGERGGEPRRDRGEGGREESRDRSGTGDRDRPRPPRPESGEPARRDAPRDRYRDDDRSRSGGSF